MIRVGLDLTQYAVERQPIRYKYRLFLKKSPNFVNLELEPPSHLLPYDTGK